MIDQHEEYKAEAFEPRNLVFFFLLAFGLTWISAILLGIFDPDMPTSITDPIILFFILIVLPGAFGPSLAAFIMTRLSEGKPGVKALWKRFWNRNLSLKWVMVTLLSYDALRLVANLVARTIDGQPYPMVDTSTPIWMTIPLFIQAFILSGMGEEFGWRGYALPRFQARWNALTSSIILGLVWASWHIPFFFIPNQTLYQRNFWEWIPLTLLSSIIYTWIFNNTKGSVLAAALIHASLNASIIVLPTYSSLWYYYGILLLLVILILLIFGPKDFVRQKPAGMPE
jgi:membrane protease YdiL (CAAX protease family)